MDAYGEMGYFGSNRSQTSALQNWAPRACVGVVVQSREGWRVGGEGVGCFSYDCAHIGGFYAGPRFGCLARLGAFRIGTMAGFGMGVMDDRSELTGHRFSTYFYAKPAITMDVQSWAVWPSRARSTPCSPSSKRNTPRSRGAGHPEESQKPKDEKLP